MRRIFSSGDYTYSSKPGGGQRWAGIYSETWKRPTHIFWRVLRVPLTESQPQFEGQMLNLARLLVDSLNQDHLGSLLAEEIKGEQSISRLERWLSNESYAHTPRDIELLRKVQRLRSKVSAHRKGSDYSNFVTQEVGTDTHAEVVGRLMMSACQMLNDLAEHFGVQLKEDLEFDA